MYIGIRPVTSGLQSMVIRYSPNPSVKTSAHPRMDQTVANISDEAKRLNTASDIDMNVTEAKKTAELKIYIKSLDFDNVSPADVTQLAFRLANSGAIALEKVSAFINIENDTEPPMSDTQKVSVPEHFKMMLGVVSSAAKTDATLNFGVQWRKESIETLNAIKAFATSGSTKVAV